MLHWSAGILATLLTVTAPGLAAAATPQTSVANLRVVTESEEESCLEFLFSLVPGKQVDCLQNVRLRSAASSFDPSTVTHLLAESNGSTDHRVIAGLLDVVRARGVKGHELAEAIARLLPHQADIYRGRDKWHVLRLRAYAFVTLSEIGFPESAMPMLVDALAYVDGRMSAVEFGAAVRVVGTLGDAGRPFIADLITLLGEGFAEEEFSLDRYETAFPRNEATTVQIEVVRSLARIATAEDEQALTVLRAIRRTNMHGNLDSRLMLGATDALQAIESRTNLHSMDHTVGQAHPAHAAHNRNASAGARDRQYESTWLEPADRYKLQNLDTTLTDHNGRGHVLGQLIDQPALLTFFYSRCQNARKCSTTMAKLGMLQRQLQKQGLAGDVRLIAVTFEPEYDTPTRLKRYATDLGVDLGTHALAVRLDVERHAAFVEELETPVSYSAGWVNTHGVEAVLLDPHGRVARKYTGLLWDNAAVIDDFQKLLAGR